MDAMCGKCKRASRHIVIAMLSGKPSRVECKACHATHGYRSPTPTPRARSRGGAPAGPAPSPEEAWTAAMRKANGASTKYATSGHYEVGQRLTHSVFGEGVVVGVSSATVCEVIFNTGTKKLLMGR